MITPSPMSTLDLLVEHLRAPFPPAEIKFLPKSPVQRGDAWVCLALPYADKRMYEDRLNALVPGRWSTPAMTPLVAGNKLVIPVTLVICEIAHTDVGEAFLTSLSRKGEPREEENAATEAYSQAFRRACAQVGLGRYLYNLAEIWVPLNEHRQPSEYPRLPQWALPKGSMPAKSHPASGTRPPAAQRGPIDQKTTVRIEGFRRILGDPIYREILWRVAHARQANAIPNAQLQADVAEAMERVSRGVRKAHTLAEQIGETSFIAILDKLRIESMTAIPRLEMLKTLVAELEREAARTAA